MGGEASVSRRVSERCEASESRRVIWRGEAIYDGRRRNERHDAKRARRSEIRVAPSPPKKEKRSTWIDEGPSSELFNYLTSRGESVHLVLVNIMLC